MTYAIGVTFLTLSLLAQAPAFTFAGVGLRSDFKAVAARYPHSVPQDQYISLARQDIHDHISAIGVSGSGETRRVRISFEITPDGGRPAYPSCAEIEAKLVKAYGPPHEIHRFSEEASPRADRIWRSTTEQLILICFQAPQGGRLFAEAVQITPR
ncbi:MAG: hypothetical protein HOP28_18270 [Gemmatimonadales bacterium]|nr:hypothetical protein [Gemmatimonadales bacterium]